MTHSCSTINSMSDSHRKRQLTLNFGLSPMGLTVHDWTHFSQDEQSSRQTQMWVGSFW